MLAAMIRLRHSYYDALINVIAVRYLLVGLCYLIMGPSSFIRWGIDAHFAERVLPYWLISVGLVGIFSIQLGSRWMASLFAFCVLIHSIYRVSLLVLFQHQFAPLIILFSIEGTAMVWLIRRLQQWRAFDQWKAQNS